MIASPIAQSARHNRSPPMILSLPFSLPDATPIGDRYAMARSNPSIATPPAPGHAAARRQAPTVRQAEWVPSTSPAHPRAQPSNAVSTARRLLEPRRRRALLPSSTPRWPRRPHCSPSACASPPRHPPTTFNENRRAGVIAAPAPARPVAGSAGGHLTPPAQRPNRRATDRATRDARDKQLLGERRTLASAGLLTRGHAGVREPAHAARGGAPCLLLREPTAVPPTRTIYGLTTILPAP